MGVTVGGFEYPFLDSCVSVGDKVCRLQDDLAEDFVSFVTRKAYKFILRDLFPNFYRDLSFLLKPFEKYRSRGRGYKKRSDAEVNTMYKRKGFKVHPRVDVPSDGSAPDSNPNWRTIAWDEAKSKLRPFRLK